MHIHTYTYNNRNEVFIYNNNVLHVTFVGDFQCFWWLNPQECWKAPDKQEEDGHKYMLGFQIIIIARLFYELLLSSYEDFSFLPLYPHSTSLKAGKQSHKCYWSIPNNYGSDGIYTQWSARCGTACTTRRVHNYGKMVLLYSICYSCHNLLLLICYTIVILRKSRAYLNR